MGIEQAESLAGKDQYIGSRVLGGRSGGTAHAASSPHPSAASAITSLYQCHRVTLLTRQILREKHHETPFQFNESTMAGHGSPAQRKGVLQDQGLSVHPSSAGIYRSLAKFTGNRIMRSAIYTHGALPISTKNGIFPFLMFFAISSAFILFCCIVLRAFLGSNYYIHLTRIRCKPVFPVTIFASFPNSTSFLPSRIAIG